MTSMPLFDQILQKYEGQRIKADNDRQLEQYFVFNNKLHYIDMGAAQVCERYGLVPQHLDAKEEIVLSNQAIRGGGYNSLQMEEILNKLGYTARTEAEVPLGGKRINNTNTGAVTQDTKETRVDKFIKSTKNHPVLSVIIVVGIAIIGLSNFTTALDNLLKHFLPGKDNRNQAAQLSKVESSSQSHVYQAGRDVYRAERDIVINQQPKGVKDQPASPSPSYTTNSVARRQSPPSTDMVILQPAQNDEVEEGCIVEFRSINSALNHYVIVTPLKSPDRWVVDGPIRVLSDGHGSGRARFGSGSIGKDERFAVTVLATAALLPEGILPRLPEKSKLASQIIVKRVRKD